MAATKQDIRDWLAVAKQEGATHLLVVCDTYDHEDFPVVVRPGQDVHAVYAQNNGSNMQRVMEVYSLALDIETQLNEHRVFNF